MTRLTAGDGSYVLPYYTASAMSPDGRFLACTGDAAGPWQAWLFDLTTGRGRPVSTAEGGVVKMISGELQPDRGHVKWGHQAQVGYLPQDQAGVIRPGTTAFGWLRRTSARRSSRSS